MVLFELLYECYQEIPLQLPNRMGRNLCNIAAFIVGVTCLALGNFVYSVSFRIHLYSGISKSQSFKSISDSCPSGIFVVTYQIHDVVH